MSGRGHLSRIHALPCVVCFHMGLPSPQEVHAHHLESVRDEKSDYVAVPLCEPHHIGPNGIHGLSRRGFEARYKLTDIDLMALTLKLLEREGLLV